MLRDSANRVTQPLSLRIAALAAAAALLCAAPTLGQQYQDEWYDPTDWFDGNDYEYDDNYGYDYDYYDGNFDYGDDGYSYYDTGYGYDPGDSIWDWDYDYSYYTNDWNEFGDADFDNWYED